MYQDRFDRDMARLEEARRRTQERLQKQQERLNQRFEQMQERLERRAGKPGISQKRIIEAALELLSEDGLANITLRKLADKIGIQAPALYWYFENKEVLVDYMAEAILQKKLGDLQPCTTGEPWQEWLITTMSKLREAMLAYPDGGRVVAGAHLYPAVTLVQVAETVLASLHEAGVEYETARHILMTATHYTFGFVIEGQAAPSESELKAFNLSEFMAPYPHFKAAMSAVNWSSATADDDFVIGLQYIIRGAGY